MLVEYIEWTLDEWLEQQALIAILKIEPSISPDVIRRIERLEKIVFGGQND